MADYHPIDVRYKGPSTAYRGSAKRNATVKPEPERTPAAKAPAQRAAGPTEASPWGGKAPAPQRSKLQRRAAPGTSRPNQRGLIGNVFRNLRRAYTALILLIIFFVFFGGPRGLTEIFSLTSGQMISMP